MREIKFRAWNVRYKQMKNVLRIHFDSKEIWVDTEMKSDQCVWSLEHCGIMQYTGIKDKNEKQIYEGDFVKTPWGIELVDDDYVKSNRLKIFKDQIEIIGSIHENPELQRMEKK